MNTPVLNYKITTEINKECSKSANWPASHLKNYFYYDESNQYTLGRR
jgi:hypothetical protein